MERVSLTQDIIGELNRLRKRAGYGAVVMLSRDVNAPNGLSGPTIHGWLSGDIKTARRDYLDFVLEAWRKAVRRTKITQEIREILLAEKVRTGCGAVQLLSSMDQKPAGLTDGAVGNWITGATQNARADHLELVIAAYASLPDSAFQTLDARRSRHIHGDRIRITPEIVKELKAYQDKSGFGPTALLKGRSDCPVKLTANRVNGWMVGRIKSARKDELAYLRRIWPEARAVERVPLTAELRSELKAMKAKTGTGEMALLYDRKNKPAGLDAAVIKSWLNGRAKTADETHLAYVIGLWGEASPYIPITKAMRQSLTDLKASCGLTWEQIRQELPTMRDKPTAATIANWANGQMKTTRADAFNNVIEWLKAQPSVAVTPATKFDRKKVGDRRIPVTPQIRKHLNDERERTGYNWKSLLNYLSPCPKGLTPNRISGWATGNLGSASGEHLFFVLDGLERLPDKPNK